MADRIGIGKWGEELATRLIQAQGYIIEARNYRTKYGEMDIIARKDETLVFIEVKTRTNRAYGLPEDSITRDKRQRLEAVAQCYLQDHPQFTGEWRIDVIAIEKKSGLEIPDVEWFENAI